MRQSHRPSTPETVSNHDPSLQLTDAQCTFADVVGRELARLWIDHQTAASATNRREASLKASPRQP